MRNIGELIEVLTQDDKFLNRIVDYLDGYDLHDLAIDAAKKGYDKLLLLLSDNRIIYNHTRVECMKHVSDVSTKLSLLSDFISELDVSDDTSPLITSITDAITNNYKPAPTTLNIINDDILSFIDDL